MNLQAVWLNSSSLQVSFHPPTTLDGVPITNYTISLSPSSGIGDNVSLTTESLLTVVNDLSWCFSYNVTVSAWNNVGEGNETFLRNRGTFIIGHVHAYSIHTLTCILYFYHDRTVCYSFTLYSIAVI